VRDTSGTLRLVVPVPNWEDFTILAFDEIRLYGAKSVQVMRRMKALASDLIAALPRSDTPRSNIIKSAWTDYCQVV
jgi:uncharacterized membrane protein